jgi:hypothetical protein
MKWKSKVLQGFRKQMVIDIVSDAINKVIGLESANWFILAVGFCADRNIAFMMAICRDGQ